MFSSEKNLQQYTDNISKEKIQSILNLLKEGDSIKYESHKNIVLFLGNTGSGKSTLTEFIAGDNNQLLSQDVGDDTGEFIIIDKNNKISANSTITSQTVFPEMVKDINTNTVYYDCPGFSDTRSLAHDVTVSYFIKKIIDSATAIKLVFVISYPSVRQGVDRQDFMLLVKHATDMIKNIEKFKDSIALVVTKVDNEMVRKKGSYTLVSDIKVINKIGDFLKLVKKELVMKSIIENPLYNYAFYENAVKFIDILLTTVEGNYSKIGIFRRPDTAGLISHAPLLQEGKTKLSEIISNNIQFVTYMEKDFGYTISSESKNYIHELTNEITEAINMNLAKIGNFIEKDYTSLEKDVFDLEYLYNQFEIGDNLLSEMQNATKFVRPRDIIIPLISITDKLNIRSGIYLSEISNYDKYLRFIETVNYESTTNNVMWIRGLTKSIDYISRSKRWYRFLLDVFNRFSEYDIQKNIAKFNTDHIKVKISSAKFKLKENKEVKVQDIGLKEFLDQFSDNYKLHLDYDDVKKSIINEPKLNALKQLLDDTLNYKVITYYPSNNKLIVKGHFVKISDIVTGATSETVQVIEILALYKVFIDASIDKTGQGAKILIFAPTWQTIQTQTILLDGKPGELLSLTQAYSGSFSGENGRDGEPGKPGGSAGHFFGIGKNFIDGENLSVYANGGQGGPGQKGGNGADGKIGKTYPLPNRNYDLKWNYGNTEFDIIWRRRSWHYYFLIFGNVDTLRATLLKPGGKGSYGADGGNGGIGGQGGYKGTIKLIEMGKKSNIITSNLHGERGSAGSGGLGGLGGIDGKSLEIDYYREWYGGESIEDYYSNSNFENKYYVEWGKTYKVNYYHAALKYKDWRSYLSGAEGTNGASFKTREYPVEVHFSNISEAVNNYKNYLKENLATSVNAEVLKKFEKRLNEDTYIMDSYDTMSLIIEFNQLEEVSNKIRDSDALLSFYDSLLHRIDVYSTNPKPSEQSLEYKQVISYLYIAVLSKICNIDRMTDSNLNLDLHNYLETLIKNVNDMKEINNLKVGVNYYIAQQNKLNAKISETKHFFDTEIPTFVNKTSTYIDKQTKTLLKEIPTVDVGDIQKVSIVEDEIEEDPCNILKKELESMTPEEKLKEVTLSKTILNYLELSQQYLNFLTGFALAYNMAQSTLDNYFSHEKVNEISALISSVQDSLKVIDNRFQNILTFFLRQLNDVNKHLTDFLQEHPSSSLNELNAKILFTLEKVTTRNGIPDETYLDSIKKDLVEIITSKKKSIIPNSLIDHVGDEEMILLDLMHDILIIEHVSSSVYEENKNEHFTITKLSQSFKGETFDKLKVYIKHLYQIMNIQDVKKKMKLIYENLQTASTVTINLKEWQMQNKLKALKHQLQKIIDEIDMDEEIRQSIENIILSTTLLVNFYDTLYSINNEARLAVYISDISSTKATEVNIQNNEFINIINKLKNLIKINIIAGQYDKAVDIVRKHVFPFAASYNDEFTLPNNVGDNNNIIEYADKISQKIKYLQSKNLESTDILDTYDCHLHNGIEFNSEYLQVSPFFTWRYNNIKDSLSKLLEGKVITLFADVLKGVHQNVIKFNEIGIQFKVADGNLQKQFDAILGNYGVTLIHQGDSHFRCGDRIFVMISDKKNIYYTFNKKIDGEPIDKNTVYDKLKNSHLVLSPYATWSVKLSNLTNTFNILNEFKNKEIDIELKGYGQYIDKEVDICTEQLETYYKQEESLFDLENQLYSEEIIKQNLTEVSSQSATISRKRRSALNEYLTNDANANTKFSIINPVNELGKWFAIGHENEVENILPYKAGTYLQLQEAEVRSTTDFTVPNLQSNLLLLDMLVKMKNKSQTKKSNVQFNKDDDNKYAHSLAYSAYLP